MMAKRKNFSDQLRDAINASPESRYLICKATRISPGNLSRFMNGTAGLSMPSLDLLFNYLDLSISPPPKRKEK